MLCTSHLWSTLLLLPLLNGASWKRERAEEEEYYLLASSLNSSSSEVGRPLKRPKFDQNVFNVRGMRKIFDWTEVIKLIVEYCTEAQALLRMSSTFGKSLIDQYKPYQRKLASDLGIPGFFELPLHSDLKVFEKFKFPLTPFSKAASLALVYGMTSNILPCSPIYKQLLGIVFDEAYALLESDPSAFELFSKVTGFNRFFEAEKFLLNFTEKQNIKGAVAMIPKLQYLFRRGDSGFDELTKQEYYKVSATLGKYLSMNPEHFSVFHQLRLPLGIILSLVCCDLPEEQIGILLQSYVAVYFVQENYVFLLIPGIRDTIFEAIFSLLCDPFDSIVPNQDKFKNRILAIISYAQQAQTESLPLLEVLRVLTICRYENYHLTETFAQLKTPQIENYLVVLLMSLGRFEEALNCLPDAPTPNLKKIIIKNSAFCKLLAHRKSEWIKFHFSAVKHLLYYSKYLVFAFYDVNNFEEYYHYSIADFRNELQNFASLLFIEGSLDEIRSLLFSVDTSDLIVFVKALNLCYQVDATRYVKIIKLFVELYDRKYASYHSNFPATILSLSNAQLIAVLEQGGTELIHKIYHQRPFNIRFGAIKEFLCLLSSEDFRGKLVAHRETIEKYFIEETSLAAGIFATHKPLFEFLHSPMEIYSDEKFLNIDRATLLKHLIRNRSTNLREGGGLNFVSYFFSLLAFRRSWHKFDHTISNYSSTDYCKEAFAKNGSQTRRFLGIIYAALDEPSKRSLQYVFNEVKNLQVVEYLDEDEEIDEEEEEEGGEEEKEEVTAEIQVEVQAEEIQGEEVAAEIQAENIQIEDEADSESESHNEYEIDDDNNDNDNETDPDTDPDESDFLHGRSALVDILEEEFLQAGLIEKKE